jgi:arylsulfatase A-like enzyme
MPLSRRRLLGRLTAPALISSPAIWAAPRRPNILLILADDLGWGDISCYHPESRIKTPNLDRLAASGVRFTDAHSPSSVCTPTRYGLLTGRYCWRTELKRGVLNGESPALIEPGRATIASMLKVSGYETGGFGKWHLGLGGAPKTDYAQELRPAPADHGFDRFWGIPASLDMPPYVYVRDRRVEELPTSAIATSGAPPRGPFWRGGPIAPSFRMDEVLPKIAANAVEFLKEKRARPAFAYVALPAPHTPWVPTRDWMGKSNANLYGDFVAQVDAVAGELTGAASRQTIVIVTSDNGAPWSAPDVEASGGHRANAAWRGQKGDIHEAGHRVPFLARGLGRRGVSNSLVSLLDVYATLADQVGHQLRTDEAGDSFVLGRRSSVVHHSQTGLFAWRNGPWKFIEEKGSGGFTKPPKIDPGPGELPYELYHLGNDPGETRDLAAQEPQQAARLRAELAAVKTGRATRPGT